MKNQCFNFLIVVLCSMIILKNFSMNNNMTTIKTLKDIEPFAGKFVVFTIKYFDDLFYGWVQQELGIFWYPYQPGSPYHYFNFMPIGFSSYMFMDDFECSRENGYGLIRLLLVGKEKNEKALTKSEIEKYDYSMRLAQLEDLIVMAKLAETSEAVWSHEFNKLPRLYILESQRIENHARTCSFKDLKSNYDCKFHYLDKNNKKRKFSKE